MDKKIQKKLVNKISEYENIIIAKHINPDGDAHGSAQGLANIIKQNFKNKKIIVVGEKQKNEINFGAESSELTDDLIKSSLLITVDTANIERIDFDRWSFAKEIFKIDHHIEVDKYGTYNMVEVEAIACTQVITLWANAMKLTINQEAAKNLYRGLITDSNRFMFPATNDETFMAANILLKSKINIQEIYNDLYISDLKIKQWMNKAFAKVDITKKGIATIKINEADYKGLDLNYEDIKSALSAMSGIKEIKIWATIISWKGEIRVSLRSREYDINSIAIKYNGGGHKFASGAKLNKMDDAKNLIKDLESLIDK